MTARTAALSTLIALSSLLATACVDDVGSGKVVAEVLASPPHAVSSEGRDLAVVTSRSRIHALGAKITARHDIVFDDWQGTLKLSGDEVVGVEATIQMSSLRADAEKLTSHLKSPDFFDVNVHPTAHFASSEVLTQSVPSGATHRVTGDLTMHGVTRRISFPATLRSGRTELEARAEFVINRQDFGITYPGKKDDLIQDNVVLTIELVAERSDS